MGRSELQMSRLRDAADSLHQRYPDITLHPAQAEEFDAELTITSAVQPQVGSYIHEPSPPASEPLTALHLTGAVGDAISQWRIITGRTPMSRRQQERMQDGPSKITCTLSG
jgi:hypothetical protein